MAELGHEVTRIELDGMYIRFMRLLENKKKIYDQDLIPLLPLRQNANAAAANSLI